MKASQLRRRAIAEFRARRPRHDDVPGESGATARRLQAVPPVTPADTSVRDLWAAKQRLARPGRYYGDGGTLHSIGQLDIEVHDGQVAAVWFRCQLLPFTQSEVNADRAMSYRHETPLPYLTGVELRDVEVD